jgi:hypothetical protein
MAEAPVRRVLQNEPKVGMAFGSVNAWSQFSFGDEESDRVAGGDVDVWVGLSDW